MIVSIDMSDTYVTKPENRGNNVMSMMEWHHGMAWRYSYREQLPQRGTVSGLAGDPSDRSSDRHKYRRRPGHNGAATR